MFLGRLKIGRHYSPIFLIIVMKDEENDIVKITSGYGFLKYTDSEVKVLCLTGLVISEEDFYTINPSKILLFWDYDIKVLSKFLQDKDKELLTINLDQIRLFEPCPMSLYLNRNTKEYFVEINQLT